MRATHYLAEYAYGRIKGERCVLKYVGGANGAIFIDEAGEVNAVSVKDESLTLFKAIPEAWHGDIFRRLSDPSQTWVCVATDTGAHTVTLKLASKVGL